MLEKATLFALRKKLSEFMAAKRFISSNFQRLVTFDSISYFRSQYYSKHKHMQGCALRKISGSPLRSQPCPAV